MSKFKHFIRYGTNAEKKYILDFIDSFDGIAFNANMVSMYAGSIANFLYHNKKLKYFIDPLTHSFAHNLGFLRNENGEIKKSLKKLSKHYGIDNIILEQNRPLKANDFTNEFVEAFFNNVIEFQENIIHKNLDNEYKELIEYIGVKKEPFCIIAPYFYMDGYNYEEWKNINLKFMNLAKEKFYSQIVITKELLYKNDFIDEILEVANQTKGVFYWIDNFDETKASKSDLKKLIEFVEKIEVEKYNLYGGYFSQLLKFKSLNGVVHGLEYGESREVVPVGGGIPVAKYYLPAIKKRLKAEEIIEVIFAKDIKNSKIFKDKICSCKKCEEIVGNKLKEIIESFLSIFAITKTFKHKDRIREYPDQESKINSLYHYLFVKDDEFFKINTHSLDYLLNELENSYKEFEPIFADGFLEYLKIWREVLI